VRPNQKQRSSRERLARLERHQPDWSGTDDRQRLPGDVAAVHLETVHASSGSGNEDRVLQADVVM
jgi:hypothetical protein